MPSKTRVTTRLRRAEPGAGKGLCRGRSFLQTTCGREVMRAVEFNTDESARELLDSNQR